MHIVIPGKPISKMRHRDSKFGGKYDPQAKEKKQVQRLLTKVIQEAYQSNNKQLQQEASEIAKADCFHLTCVFFLPIPKSLNQSKKNAILWGVESPNKKPDCSNMLKFYEDAANGILFSDDAKIIQGSFAKFYSENPRTELILMPYSNINLPKKNIEILKHFSPDEMSTFCYEAKKIGALVPKEHLSGIEQAEDADQWLIYFSERLAMFAEMYADKLKKIKSKSGVISKDISKTYQNKVHHISEGDCCEKK